MTKDSNPIRAGNAPVLQKCYDSINTTIFFDKLPTAVLLRFGKKRTHIYIDRVTGNPIYEILIHPHNRRKLREIVIQMAYSMTRIWQQLYGTPTDDYENEEFIAKLKEIGLERGKK